MFSEKYGEWALVLGASEGIGASFAMQIAERGVNVVLAARRADPLQRTAAAIVAATGREVRTIEVDLTADDLLARLTQGCEGLDIGLVVYNAGATHGGVLFHDEPLEKPVALVKLNCIGPVVVCHHFGRAMLDRGRGGIILLSSMSALAGAARVATYSATKSFDLVLAEGLWAEMQPRGVNVLCLVAGATRTPAMERSGAIMGDAFPAMDPDDVAAEGLDHLAAGPVWVAGEDNRQRYDHLRALPRTTVIEFMTVGTKMIYGIDDD